MLIYKGLSLIIKIILKIRVIYIREKLYIEC